MSVCLLPCLASPEVRPEVAAEHRPALAVRVPGPVAVVGDGVKVEPPAAHHVVRVALGKQGHARQTTHNTQQIASNGLGPAE
jgi:hypothetical protein